MVQTLVRTPNAAAAGAAADDVGTPPLTLVFAPAIEMDEDRFAEFCAQNGDLRIERTATGVIEIMPPTMGDTGSKNSKIGAALENWAAQDDSGIAFDSSSGFRLPNGAVRSPDAAWVAKSRLAALTDAEKDMYLPLCPDFVIELRSRTDRISVVQAKMAEYMDNGARLGWLLDPLTRRVYVYRPGADVEVLDDAVEISAEPELAGFALGLAAVWEPAF